MANNSTNINKITDNKKEPITLEIQVLFWDRHQSVKCIFSQYVFSLFHIKEIWYKKYVILNIIEMYKSFSIKRIHTFISTAPKIFIDTNDLCDAVLFDRDVFRFHFPIGNI